MTETPPSEVTDLKRLLAFAEDRGNAHRRVIAENVTDLFLSAEGRLSDRERALMGDILAKLVGEMESRLRKDLSVRLAQLPDAPHDLVVALANDDIEIARPILLASGALRDPDLIEIVRHRGQEHLLAVALRSPLSAEVSEAIVERDDEHVIEQLLKNSDAALSRRALEYLVAESQRVDRFQEPLLARHDLPPELAHRMFWWVSAALRRGIVERFAVGADALDDLLEETARTAIAEAPAGGVARRAGALVDAVADSGQFTEKFLLQSLRGGKLGAFFAAFAKRARVSPQVARRIVFDRGGETLALACRATGIERSSFATIFLLTRQGVGPTVTADALRRVLDFFDGVKADQARVVLRFWRADAGYLDAISGIDGSRAGTGAAQ